MGRLAAPGRGGGGDGAGCDRAAPATAPARGDRAHPARARLNRPPPALTRRVRGDELPGVCGRHPPVNPVPGTHENRAKTHAKPPAPRRLPGHKRLTGANVPQSAAREGGFGTFAPPNRAGWSSRRGLGRAALRVASVRPDCDPREKISRRTRSIPAPPLKGRRAPSGTRLDLRVPQPRLWAAGSSASEAPTRGWVGPRRPTGAAPANRCAGRRRVAGAAAPPASGDDRPG